MSFTLPLSLTVMITGKPQILPKQYLPNKLFKNLDERLFISRLERCGSDLVNSECGLSYLSCCEQDESNNDHNWDRLQIHLPSLPQTIPTTITNHGWDCSRQDFKNTFSIYG